MALSDYAQDFLGNLYDYLSLSAGDIAFIVSETLETMDLADESLVTSSNTKAVHQVLKVRALEHCLNMLAVDFKISVDGSSYDRQQVYDMVSKRLELAYADAQPYLPENQIIVGEIEYPENPYRIETYLDWWL